MDTYFEIVGVGLLGLIIGSFLNVCIARLPDPTQNLWNRSHCPHCNRRIKWYDTIPILSFIFLRGRCRWCVNKISWQYLIVESLTATLFLTFLLKFDLSWEFAFYCGFCSLLVVIVFIDINQYLILNQTVVTGFIFVVIFFLLFHTNSLKDFLIGILFGGSSIWIISVLGKLVFGRESMGGGDIKLGMLLGAALGLEGVFLTLISAVGLGAVVGITGIILGKLSFQDKLPFGLFLGIGTVIYIFEGEYLFNVIKSIYGLG